MSNDIHNKSLLRFGQDSNPQPPIPKTNTVLADNEYTAVDPLVLAAMAGNASVSSVPYCVLVWGIILVWRLVSE